jgi:hypothetical protein
MPLASPCRRWLDGRYAIPAAVTAARSSITVTLTPAPGSPAWPAGSYRAVPLTP